MSDDLATLDLCGIADRIRGRDVSAETVTRAAIARAEKLQPTLNTFIRLEADSALTTARDIDVRIAKDEAVGPLAGVPLAHKDMFYRKGLPTSCGSKIRADFVADRTSTSLARLATAGTIDLGGLNMSEFAVGPIGNNVHYGDCHNPWNPGPRAGRLVQWLRRLGRGADRLWRARLGHRRINPHPVRHVRRRRLQADAEPRQPLRTDAALLLVRHQWTAHPHGARCRPHHRCHCGPRPKGPDIQPTPSALLAKLHAGGL